MSTQPQTQRHRHRPGPRGDPTRGGSPKKEGLIKMTRPELDIHNMHFNLIAFVK